MVSERGLTNNWAHEFRVVEMYRLDVSHEGTLPLEGSVFTQTAGKGELRIATSSSNGGCAGCGGGGGGVVGCGLGCLAITCDGKNTCDL